MEPNDLALLCIAAFAAGLIDAVVGGGGLIQIPALFNALPQSQPATLFGTNKLASIFGTGSAALRYARRIDVPWRAALPAAVAAFVLSYFGAMTVALLPKEWLRPLVLALLVSVTVYTYLRKDLGAVDQRRHHGRRDMLLALFFGGVIGFYDGFFGPGTGSFLVFMFVRLFGLDFLRASVSAKIVNAATNLSALLFFGAHGHVLVAIGLAMALFNIAGAQVGSHLAILHGAGFVRRAFLAVATGFILKFAWDTIAI
ncbi:MAG: TSUP family transporter [Rhodocyclaceae bacterium]|nr:TSUP family transporter [Rhodocyclaceae bacterium]